MAATVQKTFQMHFWMKAFLQSCIEMCFDGLIDNKSVLVQVMAWRPTGAKPLSEAILTKS